MATFKDKISNLLNSQVPDFVLEDHPLFLDFVKAYYKFLESAEITLTNIGDPDHLQLDNQTNAINFIQLNGTNINGDDDGDRILLEDTSYGDFVNGETITGQTSGATATVLIEDVDGGSRLFVTHQNKFIEGELIIGSTSAAEATISKYRANPVQNIQQLLDYPDPDKTIQGFLTKFRNAFLASIPDTLDGDIDKRKLIKNIKSLYRAKGTNKGHELFFRLLFGLESETIYPRENILRASDGKWDTRKILRAIGTTGNTLDLIGRTIEGETSEATAVVENVFKFQIGANEVTEFVLNEDTISGTFQISEVIRGTETDDEDIFIKAVVTGIPSSPSITNDGSLYNETDSVTVTGGGQSAIIQVDAIGRGGIEEIIIDSSGSGYEIGDDIVFTNTGTGGGSARAKVSVVNGGLTQETSTSTTEDHIVLEDETTRGDSYTGNKIVQESGTGSGDITDIRIISTGNNYQSLPTVEVDDTNGSGAVVYAYGDQIGRIQGLKILSPGVGYEASPTPPTLTLPSYLIISDISGTFNTNDTITGVDISSTSVTATIVSYSSDTGLLKVSSPTGQFAENTTITSSNASTATVRKNNLGTASISVSAVVDTDGAYINQDGHVSETSMRIQDSLYYQDFSYVIKVGRTINDWRDSFKKTVHSAGFYFTGQVNIETAVSAEIQRTVGINSNIDYEQVALIVNTLFSTIFGRRLGTTTDGTTLRVTPQLGVDPDFDDSTSDHFTSNTRDLTLTQSIVLKGILIKELTNIRNNTTKYGVPVAGPTLKSINKLVLGQNFANQVTIAQLNALTLKGTKNTNIDGEQVLLSDYPFRLKSDFAIPSEIWQISGDSFDETLTTFDQTDVKFDVA